MQSFLAETIQKLEQKEIPLSNYLLIVPSKRAAGFLRQELVKSATKNFFSPTILSIEEFIANISGLQQLSKTSLLLEGFKVYSKIQETTFETYLSWVEPILNDFNEIDRHLVPQKEFFDYLSSIKLLEKWGLTEQETPMIKEYISFWESVETFYTELTESLLSQQKGYQGLLYRKAVEELEFYLERNRETPHAFIGFNALNKAEQTILQELLEQGNAEIYWDMDAYFAEDPEHSVSHFYRGYLKHWKWFEQNGKPVLSRNFERPKTFHLIEAQADIEQVKYAGALLSKYSEDALNKTAIVLADESLLIPLLYSLPSSLQQVNVTMGYPMKALPAVQFFMQWLEQASSPRKSLYYRNLQKLLSHPVGQHLAPNATAILNNLAERNRTHLSLVELLDLAEEENRRNLRYLFGVNPSDVQETLTAAIALLNYLLEKESLPLLEKMVFHKLWLLFEEIQGLQATEGFLSSNNSLKLLFEMMLHSEALDIEGDAYNGLQIMGMLETRVLDFENVIVLSVNEGTLPTGKSHASYLTYDLKKQFDLPMHTEKDAVYAYHFFRLLQRTDQATLLYNNASGGLSSGEKSRFLLQLEIEKPELHQIYSKSLQQKVAFPEKELKSYEKNEAILERLTEIAARGFSPSALTSFIRNPRDFYYQRILRIKELDEVEETVAYNTLGTIVHGALEELYKPMVGKELTATHLQTAKAKVTEEVENQFKQHYKLGDYQKGKNLIIYEVAKRYVNKLIDWDFQAIEGKHTIELVALESELQVPLEGIGLDFPVHLKGMVDRIDRINGQLRIIDYKTGKVESKHLNLKSWEDLIEDYDYSKAFQVLAYAYMYYQKHPFSTAQAGIVSFKSMKNGFMSFIENGKKNSLIDAEILKKFEAYLFELIKNICDPTQAFVEKEIPEKNW